MKKKRDFYSKMSSGIVIIIILLICLCITTYALVYATLTVENNFFHTGSVKINLNDGEKIVSEDEILFEPGVTVKKEFFIENQSTESVYYRLYFADIEGDLADVLDISIEYGDKILYSGKMSNLVKSKIQAADDILEMGERHDLTIIFTFPTDYGNDMMAAYLNFTLCADGVQTKNNPNRLF